MFTKIAWATDGSESSFDALPLAKRLARATGGKLTIIHVQEVTVSLAGVVVQDNDAALAALRRTVQQLRDAGIDTGLLTAKATPRDVPRRLLDLAEIADADVLVVGNRGHGSLSNFLLGSVSARLRRIASMPIIAAPSGSAVATQLAVANAAA